MSDNDTIELEVGGVYQKRGTRTGEKYQCVCVEKEANGRVKGLFYTLSQGLLPLVENVELEQYERVDDLPRLREAVAFLEERVKALELRRVR